MDHKSVKMNLMRPEDVPEEAAADFARTDIVRYQGFIFLHIGDQVLRCEDGEAGEAVIRALEAKSSNPSHPDRKSDPWFALLTGDSRGNSLIPGIQNGTRRCLVLFEAAPGQEKTFSREVWDDLAPMERGDAATETEDGSIALIKRADGHTDDEIAEFAAAVIETIETETGIQLQAGIGSSVRKPEELRQSLREARQAIATGRMFQPDGRVFVFSRQTMERMICAIPEEARGKLRNELLSTETGKQLNPEIMETIRAFFRNDLNLSTTARELFIHRNTLIYRLEKVRKETGFDLRKFQDAAVFHLISRIPPEDEKGN